MALQDLNMMPLSRLDRPLSLETAHMENPGSMRFHPIGGDLKTTKTDKKHGSRQESHPLLDRSEFDWPCST